MNRGTFGFVLFLLVPLSSIVDSLVGISSHARPDCVEDAKEDPCAISIHHRIRPTDAGSSYYQWSQGDDYLDWYGAEDGQGDFGQVEAGGTPMMWTTWQ